MFAQWLPLARREAWRLFDKFGRHHRADIEDLEQMAAIGLMHAIERYDPARATVRFPQYAPLVIRQSVLDQLRAEHTIARAGNHDFGIVLIALSTRYGHAAVAPKQLERIEAIERWQRVERGIQALRPKQRAAVRSVLAGATLESIGRRNDSEPRRAAESRAYNFWSSGAKTLRRRLAA